MDNKYLIWLKLALIGNCKFLNSSIFYRINISKTALYINTYFFAESYWLLVCDLPKEHNLFYLKLLFFIILKYLQFFFSKDNILQKRCDKTSAWSVSISLQIIYVRRICSSRGFFYNWIYSQFLTSTWSGTECNIHFLHIGFTILSKEV